MKMVVISDSHGDVTNIKFALGFAKKINAKALIHCGDWDNLRAVKMVYSYKIPVYGVLGNADIDTRIAKIVNGRWLEVNLGGRKIGVVHNIKDIIFKKKKLDIIFCGHKHFKSERVINGVKVVSPGALHSIEPSFAVYDTGTNEVEFCDL